MSAARPHPRAPDAAAAGAAHARRHSGLPRRRVEQLIVKTLFAGELTGLEMAERMKVAYGDLRAAHRAAAHRADDRGARRQRRVELELPLRAHRPRADARAAVSRDQPLHRRHAGAAGRLRQADEGAAGGARLHRSRAAAQGLLAPGHRRRHAGEAGAGRQRQQGDLSLRAARQRQDGDCRRAGPCDRRRHVHAVRDRRGRAHHHDVRPDQPRAARRRRARHRRASSPPSRATAAGCASAARS